MAPTCISFLKPISTSNSVPTTSPEFAMLKKFLHSMTGWKAYRTELVIYGERENLGGSIDLCAVNASGELAIIDWKRTSALATKYGSPQMMKVPLSHLPDCAGQRYRLQLNSYRYILESYYGFRVARMLIVCTHPDNQAHPFVDEVPRMDAEVSSMMQVWREFAVEGLVGGSKNLENGDVQGGASARPPAAEETEPRIFLLFANALGGSSQPDDLDRELDREMSIMMEEQQEEETRNANENVNVENGQPAEDANGEEEPGADADPLVGVKKRRLMKGAQTTAEDFRGMFARYDRLNAESLVDDVRDVPGENDNILERCERLWDLVRRTHPSWSEHMVRLGAAAVACCSARVGGRIFIGDNAFFLWLVEGDRFLRVHSGFCYIYNSNGAFQPYSGIPPQAVLFRICSFFTELEGVFRRMSSTVKRQSDMVLRAIAADLARFENETSFLKACSSRAVYQQPSEDDEGIEEETALALPHADEAPQANRSDWTANMAQAIWKICQSLRGDMMHDRLISLLVEWCETTASANKCVAYQDTCVVYDRSVQRPVQHVRKSASNNCYIYVPHCWIPCCRSIQRGSVHSTVKHSGQTMHSFFATKPL